MDWLTKQVLISIVAGLFTLAFFLCKRKKNKSDEISLEKRAQKIIKQYWSEELGDAPSYKEVKKELGATGFMEVYLVLSKNYQTMSNTADYNVMLELASIDQFRDHNTIFINFLKL